MGERNVIVRVMDVFVIPVAKDRYELYYEQATDEEPDDDPAAAGLIAKLQRRFRELLRAAEEHRHKRADSVDTPRSWTGRMQDRMLGWIAERIAEQRMLWNLRKQERVIAVHPTDTTFDAVMPHIRTALQRDFERHRFWLVLDTAGLLISAALTLIPGPNLLAYYFIFRVGGHWLSLRGASQGMRRVQWEGRPCEALDGLRAAVTMPRRERLGCLQQVGAALHLRHFVTFFEGVVAKHSARRQR